MTHREEAPQSSVKEEAKLKRVARKEAALPVGARKAAVRTVRKRRISDRIDKPI